MQQTVVAVAIAKLNEAAMVAQQQHHGSFAGTGKALSVAAGRLSYTHSLKAGCLSAASPASLIADTINPYALPN